VFTLKEMKYVCPESILIRKLSEWAWNAKPSALLTIDQSQKYLEQLHRESYIVRGVAWPDPQRRDNAPHRFVLIYTDRQMIRVMGYGSNTHGSPSGTSQIGSQNAHYQWTFNTIIPIYPVRTTRNRNPGRYSRDIPHMSRNPTFLGSR